MSSIGSIKHDVHLHTAQRQCNLQLSKFIEQNKIAMAHNNKVFWLNYSDILWNTCKRVWKFLKFLFVQRYR